MPQVFKVESYWVYFWANENEPLEPVHVHIAESAPAANGTKAWITKAGKCLLCNIPYPGKSVEERYAHH